MHGILSAERIKLARRTGIYRLVHIPTGDEYIGSSAKCLSSRLRLHIRSLRQGKHHNRRLQAVVDKDGLDQLHFEVLEFVPPESCLPREQHYFDTRKPSLNVLTVAGSSLGLRHSEESRHRIRVNTIRACGGCNDLVVETVREAWESGWPLRRIVHALELPLSTVKHIVFSKRTIRDNGGKPLRRPKPPRLGVCGQARVTAPDGTVHNTENLKDFCRQMGLDYHPMWRTARNHRSDYHGWRAEFLETAEESTAADF